MRVDFAFDAHERISQAVRTTVKQVSRGNRILVYCDEISRLNQFDAALWSLPGTAFIAHEFLGGDEQPDLPVYLVDAGMDWQASCDLLGTGFWLLNLSDDCPPLTQPIPRILEIVSADPQDRALARSRWRIYQQAGYALHAHQLEPS